MFKALSIGCFFVKTNMISAVVSALVVGAAVVDNYDDI